MQSGDISVGMRPAHPGDFIRTEVLDALGLSVAKASEVLGVRRATLSDLLNGKASISPEMALRVEKAFGIDMGMLLKMQAWLDAYEMRKLSRKISVKRYVPA